MPPAMPNIPASDALAAVHETAQGLTRASAMSEATMKSFGTMCPIRIEDLSPDGIRAIRLRQLAEQFPAQYLNGTTSLVSQWKRDEKSPPRRLAEVVDPRGKEGPCGGEPPRK